MYLSNANKRYQFSLRTLLYVTAGLALILAVGKALTVQTTQLMSCIFVMFATPVLACVLLTRLHKKQMHRHPELLPAIGSIILITACTTITAVVLVAVLAGIPRRATPIQYISGSSYGAFLYLLKFLTTLFLLCTPVASGLVGMARFGEGRKLRLDWFIAGIASFLIACLLVMHCEFFPTD